MLAMQSQSFPGPSGEMPFKQHIASPASSFGHNPDPNGVPSTPYFAPFPFPQRQNSQFPPQPPSEAQGWGVKKRKVTRAGQACCNCREKKAKCDEGRPSCGPCLQRDIVCVYSNTIHSKQLISASTSSEILQLFHEISNRLDEISFTNRQSIGMHPGSVPQLPSQMGSVDFQGNGNSIPRIAFERSDSAFELSQPHSATWEGSQSFSTEYGDVKDVKLAIPPGHTTAAHDLRSWRTIKPFFQGIPERYVNTGELNHHIDLSHHRSAGLNTSNPDPALAATLLESYLNNIHVILPFLSRKKLSEQVDRYVRNSRHSTPATAHRQLGYGMQKVDVAARTDETALVLLVFALGAACRRDLPAEAPFSAHRRSETTPESSPDTQYNTIDSFGNPTLHHDIPQQSRPLPGLALFTHAVGILGETHFNNTLVHVEACLLAGLYLSQFLYVHDSWKWINSACMSWRMYFKGLGEDVAALSTGGVRIYWACLLLESDILAELDLIHSGLSAFEDDIPYPSFDAADDDLVILEHYSAQIHLRKILNRAHSALYNPKKNTSTWAWARLTSSDLAQQLEDWRLTLPHRLRWDEPGSPCAPPIAVARLRAKYMGARNIIFRPYLREVIEDMLPEAEYARANLQVPNGSEEYQKLISNALQCVHAIEESTVAFDGVPGMPEKLIVTNLFGTSHAQFGNMLVLGAACLSPVIAPLVDVKACIRLIKRTIRFLRFREPSPTMSTNVRVLENVLSVVHGSA